MYVNHMLCNTFAVLSTCYLSSVSGEAKCAVPTVPVDPREDAKLAKLVEMGFEMEVGKRALQQCQGDMEAVCDLLASTPDSPSASSRGLLSSLARYTNQPGNGLRE